ncbi:DciA family protein [Streptomyces sp. NRRL F-5135]|uniref:DciA family protein n=1 Tax=Streptomyces sp. NRRL F-5135 TaxID=1463858 RepID=UPI00068F82F0|nr:DciA family protein [Streptomyces sp. NRRL F-5135]
MPDHTPTASGVDLARQALAAYKTAASTRPAAPRKAPRIRRDRSGGRDPVTFAAAIERINAEQGWELGLDGGNILHQWPVLCPQYDGLIAAEGFDPDQGRLDLRPSSNAYATQLRLLGGQLAKQINDKLGRAAVRTIRVLAVGPGQPRSTAPTVTTAGTPDTTAAPVRTRENASAGYRRTLALALEHRPTAPEEGPLVAAARARLNAAVAHPSRREPADAFTEAVVEAERVAAPAHVTEADAVYQTALRVARAQKAEGPLPRRVFDVA